MLNQNHEPLEHHCRTPWSLAVVLSTAIVIAAAWGLRLDAAPPQTVRLLHS